MVNLNNSPAGGPLTADDLVQWRRTGSGVQAAEAATDVGPRDDLDAARGIVYCIPAAILAWSVIAAVAVAWRFWPF